MFGVSFSYWLIVTFVHVSANECGYDDIEIGCIEGPVNQPLGTAMGFQVQAIDNTLYPYMVSLQERLGNKQCYKHFCGGTMIAPNLVLTAAHCMDDIRESQPNTNISGQHMYWPKSAKYFAAISPRCRHLESETYARFAIDEIYIHPEYRNSRGALHNDVAVVQLAGDKGRFYEGPLVQFADQNMQISDIQKPLQTIGYGKVRDEPDPKSPLYRVYPLHGGELTYMEYDMCKQILFDKNQTISAEELDYATMVCFYNPSADTCEGDSGGPLLDGDMQIGIVSWGPGASCNVTNAAQAPSIFVRLPDYIPWIKNIIQNYGCQALTLCQTEDNMQQVGEKCITVPNANAEGELIDTKVRHGLGSEDCCKQCKDHPDCNVCVYCPRKEGCINQGRPNEILEHTRCDLKFQDQVAQGQIPSYWFTGPETYFQSGYILGKKRGKELPAPSLRPTPSHVADVVNPIPTLKTTPVPSSCSLKEALFCDVDALQAFKKSVTRGSSLLSSWEGSDPCTWKYIECDKVDGTNDRVVKFIVNSIQDTYKLSASLVPEFSNLRFLREFKISAQNITGQLWEEYSVLDKLTQFWVARTELKGTLPSTYSFLTNISDFQSSFNNIQGTIPIEFSQWTNLEIIYLGLNKLQGTLAEEFSVWTKLIEIDVPENRLTGTLSPTFSAWDKVSKFWVFENDLSGSMPPEYSSMTSMDDFATYKNRFTDVLPVQWSTWEKCRKFRSYGCLLTGTLPIDYSVMSIINILAVYQNKLSGTIPPAYSTWRLCSEFLVWDNRLTGPVPREFSTMSRMKKFSVSSNDNLSGSLPAEYSFMQSLELFQSFGTNVLASIPTEWSVYNSSVDIKV